jgi:selenoprotein W-related protein
LAAELGEEFGVESKLVPGEHGIFDVIVDGQTVFSKFETGRFPGPGEVIEKIKKEN